MDHHATTPTDERVVEAMMPYFTEVFGNPSSLDHTYGAEANQAVQRARKQIASAINADPSEIVFTSGATEAGPGRSTRPRRTVTGQRTSPRRANASCRMPIS